VDLFWIIGKKAGQSLLFLRSTNPPTALQSVLLDTELATLNRTQIGTDEEAHRNTTHHPATHSSDLGKGVDDQASQD
jgi:hypothetical protein